MTLTAQGPLLLDHREEGGTVLKQLIAVLQKKRVSQHLLRQRIQRRLLHRNSLPQLYKAEQKMEHQRLQKNQKDSGIFP